jgi:DNA-binding NtrC family response regulator
VALSGPGGLIEASHLSPDLTASRTVGRPGRRTEETGACGPQPLAPAVDRLEREIIQATLNQARGNISEAARVLELTRRGLYLKLRRLGLQSPAGDPSGPNENPSR